MDRFIGLIEMNGSFVVNIIKNEAFSSGYSVGLNFTLRSSEDDLLNHVQTLLSDKNIETKIKNNNLLIVGNENLQRFIKMIEGCGHFISFKRQKEFIIFKDILNMHKNKLHLTPDGIEKIRKRKEGLKWA